MTAGPTVSAKLRQAVLAAQQTKERPSTPEEQIGAFRERLIRRLWWELPLLQADPANLNSVEEIVPKYNDSISLLRAFRSETVEFVDALCESHFILIDQQAERPDHLQANARGDVDRLRALVDIPQIAVSRNLHAEIFGLEADRVYAILLNDLQQATRQFADHLLTALQTLFSEQVIGFIDWPVESSCRFRYYATVVSERDIEANRTGTTIQHSGKVDFQQKVSQQELTNTRRHALPRYKQFIPNRFRDLLDRLPDWLRPDVEVVEGDLFRSDVCRKHLRTEEWQETEVLVHEDPAVCLGPYVLAAWLCEQREEEEHQVRQERRRHDRDLTVQRQSALGRCCLRLAGVAGLQILAAALFFFTPLGPLAAVLALLFLYPVLGALREYAWSLDVVPDAYYHVMGTVSAVLGGLALHCLVLLVVQFSWPAMAGFALTAGAAAFFIHETVTYIKRCSA